MTDSMKHTVPIPGDVYIKFMAVYRVVTYNETDDTVLFATTNDIITMFGKVRRSQIREQALYPCPYQLLNPAVQVFELDEKFDDKSLEALKAYRQHHIRTYEKLELADLFHEIEDMRTRIYKVPEEQGQEFPDLKGKSFDVPIPFLCITKKLYQERYRSLDIPAGQEYYAAMKHRWPIFYVPSRFG